MMAVKIPRFRIQARNLIKIAIFLTLFSAIHSILHFHDYDDFDYFTSSLSSDHESQNSIAEDKTPLNDKTRLRVLLSADQYKENKVVVRNHELDDPRLLPAYWLYILNNGIKSEDENAIKLPFNWNLLTDFPNLIKKNPYYNRIKPGKKFTCSNFGRLDKSLRNNEDLPQNFERFDETYCRDGEANEYNLPFTIVKKLDGYFHDYHFRKLYNMIYSLASFPAPANAMFLNLIPSESEEKGHRSLMLPLYKVDMGFENDLNKMKSYSTNISRQIIETELAKNATANIKDILTRGLNIPEQVSLLQSKIKDMDLPYVPSPEIAISTATIVGGSKSSARDIIAVPEKEFNWFLPDVLKELDDKSTLKPYLERNLDLFYDQDRYYGVSHVKNMKLDHYDWRFFKEETFKTANALHNAVLHRLARTWFALCQNFEIATWINHGPLIGWYWNGLVMPFDSDLDLTLPIQSLHRLAKFMNDTIIYDFTALQKNRYIDAELGVDSWAELGMRGFYFEVNNNYPHRNRYLSGKNNIDARLIDPETGVYIDITALASFRQSNFNNITYERDLLKSMSNVERQRFYKGAYYDSFYDGIYTRVDIPNEDVNKNAFELSVSTIEQYDQYISTVHSSGANTGLENPSEKMFDNLIIDRNYHAYRTNAEAKAYELLPIFFENSEMYIPRDFLSRIVIEYGTNAIVSNYHNYFRFFKDLRIWISHDSCPMFNEINGNLNLETDTESGIAQQCMESNAQVMFDYNLVRDYTALHSELHSLVVDFKDVKNSNVDAEKLKSTLAKFDDSKILRPEVWCRNHLFDIGDRNVILDDPNDQIY